MDEEREKINLSIDLTKEWERGKSFLQVLNEPKPIVGETTKQVVWKKNKAQLWYYPADKKKFQVPVFQVYSLVNKSYILDLAPGASITEALVKSGYDVYLLDWGVPGYEDKDLSLDNYIIDYLQAGVKHALRHSKAEEISIIGYCLGGTLAAIYTAIADEPIKNFIGIAVPIDLSHVPYYENWAEEFRLGNIDIDHIIDAYGLIPATLVEMGVRAVTSPLYFSHYFSLLNRVHNDQFVQRWRKMNMWTNDHIPFAGETLRQLAKDLVRDNKLVKGELIIRNKQVDLKNIKVNLLVISTSLDTIVPKELSLPIMNLVSSIDKTYKSVEGGHVSLILKGGIPDFLDHWLAERSSSL